MTFRGLNPGRGLRLFVSHSDEMISPVVTSEEKWATFLNYQWSGSGQDPSSNFLGPFIRRAPHGVFDTGPEWAPADVPVIAAIELEVAAGELTAEPISVGLGLSESFVPSVRSLSIWGEGLKSLTDRSKRPNLAVALASVSLIERAQRFSEVMHATLGSFAQYLRYNELEEFCLADAQSFDDDFQFAILDGFQLIPDKARLFNRSLLADIRGSLARGWAPDGDWGYLELLEDGRIFLRLRPIEFFEDDAFVESVDGD